MKAEMRGGVFVAPALTVALLLTGCGGVSRRDDVRRNEAILTALPVFPGAVKTHEFSTPQYGNGEASDPTGYTTTVVYRVPPAARGASVRRFYESRLGRQGWQSSVLGRSSPGAREIVYLRHGKELAIVNTITLRRVGTYTVVVDHRH
jgi:hypothetical protein